MDSHTLLGNLSILFVSVGITAIGGQRLKIPLIPAYMICGIIVGPHVLGLISSADTFEQVSRIAVLLLLFGVGLELHVSALGKDLLRMVSAALLSCLLIAAVTWPIGYFFGLNPAQSIAVGLIFSLSSTAVALRYLGEKRELFSAHGRWTLAILVTQDLLVIFILAVLPMILSWHAVLSDAPEFSNYTSFDISDNISQLIKTLLMLIAFTVASKLLLPRILRESLRNRSLELMMIVGISIALSAAWITHTIGLSEEMGAFFVGFLLADSPFRHQLTNQIAPLRDIFMALFFITIGMNLDVPIVISAFGAVTAVVVITIAMKFLAIAFSTWLFGATAGLSLCVAAFLAHAGEFSLVLLATIHSQNILNENQFSLLIASVIVSIILTPFLFRLSRKLHKLGVHFPNAPWVARDLDDRQENASHNSLPNQVIIVGFGPIGQSAMKALSQANVAHSVVELNPSTVEQHAKLNCHMVFGDAGHPAVLELAGIETAQLLLITIPDADRASLIAATARSMSPNLTITSRCPLQAKVQKLKDAGVDHIIVDELSAATLFIQVIERRILGLSPSSSEEVHKSLEEVIGEINAYQSI